MRTMYLEKGWYNQVSEEKKARTPRMPKLWEALVTMLILVGALALGIVKYETDPHVPMFIGVMGAALMALYLGYKWEAIEKSMMDGIYKALQSVCILVIVGILIGVWINAGVVPTMIFYGLKVLKPAIFFIASVLICSITSLATGTSWGTMGTMGVALMGIGFGLGMSPGMTAGAVLSPPLRSSAGALLLGKACLHILLAGVCHKALDILPHARPAVGEPALHPAGVPQLTAVQLPPQQPQGFLAAVFVQRIHQCGGVIAEQLGVRRVLQMLAQLRPHLVLDGLRLVVGGTVLVCVHVKNLLWT